MKSDVLQKRETLLKQCPLVISSEDRGPIHITQWGETGPTVLMIHGGVQGGLGGGPVNFAGQAPLAETGWTLRLPDRPGFGKTVSRGPDDQLADALWVSEELRKGSHLIGHSFGGAIALLAAARHPQAVRSLILIEPALQPMLTTKPLLLLKSGVRAALQIVGEALTKSETPAEFARAFAESLGTDGKGDPNPSLAALLEHPDRAETLGCAVLRARIAPPDEMRKAADTLAKARIPVVFVSGGYSTGQDAGCAAMADMMGAKHVVISAPNHFIQQASPDAFNEFADNFMREAEKNRA
jgi:pimeloyl-ACP methyl ester carboxylesterase